MPIYGPTGAEYAQQQVDQTAQTGQLLQNVGQMAQRNRELEEEQRQFNVAQGYEIMRQQLPAYGNNVAVWAMNQPGQAKQLIDGLYGEGSTEQILQQWKNGNITPEGMKSIQQDFFARGDMVYKDVMQRLQDRQQQGGGGQPQPQPQPQDSERVDVRQQYSFTGEDVGGAQQQQQQQQEEAISSDKVRQAFRSEVFGIAAQGNKVDEDAIVDRYAKKTRFTEDEIRGWISGDERSQMTENPVPLYDKVRQEGAPQSLDLLLRQQGGEGQQRQEEETSQIEIDPISAGLQETAKMVSSPDKIKKMGEDEQLNWWSRTKSKLMKKEGMDEITAETIANQALYNIRHDRKVDDVPSKEERKNLRWYYRTEGGDIPDFESFQRWRSGGAQRTGGKTAGGQQRATPLPRSAREGRGLATEAGLTKSEDRALDKISTEDKLDKKEEKNAKQASEKVKKWVLADESVKDTYGADVANRAVQIMNQAQPEDMPANQNQILFDFYHDEDAIDAMLKEEQLRQAAVRNKLDAVELAQAADEALIEQAKAKSDRLSEVMDRAYEIFGPRLEEIAKNSTSGEEFDNKFRDFLNNNKAAKNFLENYNAAFSELTGTNPEYVKGATKRNLLMRILTMGASKYRTEDQSIFVAGGPPQGGRKTGGGQQSVSKEARAWLQKQGIDVGGGM